MVRIIIAAVLALVVAFSAVATAQQTVRASRWQPDQFGPIVPTDTMWSIAGYYSRQQGVSLHEMMDRIVAANPRAFRDNRPDFMLTGFFLDIPELGAAAAPVQSVTANTTPAQEAETTEQQQPSATTTEAEPAVSTNVEREIAISVSELQALRTQLSDSIDLIENLQGENSQLQERLAAVTRELNELRARADVEQQASTEMELMAQELTNEEITRETVANEPSTATDEPTSESQAATETESTDGQQATAEIATTDEAEPAVETEPSAETTEPAAATDSTSADAQPVPTQRATTSKARKESWLDWLMKPLHLLILGGLLVILLGALAYSMYVRRINREIEQGGKDDEARGAEVGDDTTTASMHDAPATDEVLNQDMSDADKDEHDPQAWQETEAEQDYAEVTDVDLDAYLRERGEDSQDQTDEAPESTAVEDNHDDDMSREVNELLAMEFPEQDAQDNAQDDETEQADEIAEYRVPEPDESADSESEDEQTRGELDEVLDSFGGLRLDEDDGVDSTTDTQPSEDAQADEQATEDEDYLSIESLMEEAETEASEEQEDPYDKDKLGGALGDDVSPNETDLSTEEMLDESKSPAAKLDLAQVYIDMGEIDDARELLESIAGCGDDEAESDAAELLKKLAEQGGR